MAWLYSAAHFHAHFQINSLSAYAEGVLKHTHTHTSPTKSVAHFVWFRSSLFYFHLFCLCSCSGSGCTHSNTKTRTHTCIIHLQSTQHSTDGREKSFLPSFFFSSLYFSRVSFLLPSETADDLKIRRIDDNIKEADRARGRHPHKHALSHLTFVARNTFPSAP